MQIGRSRRTIVNTVISQFRSEGSSFPFPPLPFEYDVVLHRTFSKHVAAEDSGLPVAT